MKKSIYVIITGIGIVCILFFCIMTIKNVIFLKKEENTQLIVQLRDGFTGLAVSDARVVLAQTGADAVSDRQGMTPALYVTTWETPYQNLPHRLQTPWQEVTILVYHEQYVDTVLLHVMVEEGEENIITIELFQKNDLPNEQVVISSQTPNHLWVEKLLEYFR